MDYDYENGGCFRYLFRSFVLVTLTLLLFLEIYAYVWGPSRDSINGDFSDIKYVVMQLTRGLSESWYFHGLAIPFGCHQIDVSVWLYHQKKCMYHKTNNDTKDDCKVNSKHERLQSEMERISAVLPAVAAAAGRAKDALEPSLRNSRMAIDLQDYDRQMADYALESAGARVLDTGDTIEHVIYESPASWALHILSSWLCRECQGARAMIRPGTLPGECWAFKGPRGEATIRLLGTVRVTAISIEHIPPHISPTREISSAPRLFQVDGLEFRTDPYPHEFGSFEYDKDGKPIQYFEILHPSPKGYNLVRVRVLTNWGHPVYTCVYRVRVHGELVSGQTPQNLVSEDGELRIENE